jgi:O-antigen/teichoic acid export membrane protein
MSLATRIRSGVTWLMVGRVANGLLAFAIGIALARLLVPKHFGMMVALSALTGFVGMFADAGMGQSLIRAKEVSAEDFDAVLTMQLLIGALVYVALFAGAPWVAAFFNDPLYAPLLRVSALSFLMRPFYGVHIAWLNREMAYRTRVRIEVIAGAIGGACAVLMAFAGLGVWSLVLSGLIGAAAANVLLARATRLRLRLRLRVDVVRRHASYSFKTVISDAFAYLSEQTVNVVLTRLAGAAAAGLFNKAESLARFPNRAVTPAVGQTVMRALSDVQDDLQRSSKILYRTITLLMVYIYPFLVGLWWIADSFVGLVYGPNWLPCVPALRTLVLVGLVRTIIVPCGTVLAAQDRLASHIAGQATAWLLLVVASLVGLRWGIDGVAWAVVASQLYLAFYAYALVCRALPTRPADLLTAAAPALLLNALLFVSLGMADSVFAGMKSDLPWVYTAGMVLVGVVTYAMAFFFLPISALRSEALRWRQLLATPFRARPSAHRR